MTFNADEMLHQNWVAVNLPPNMISGNIYVFKTYSKAF